GTVVDADDLLAEMVATAKQRTEELGKVAGFSEEEKHELYHMIGLGALKYFLLKVEPKKRLLFDPNESIDFQGNTGPFIQYTHARIQSVLNKASYVASNTTFTGSLKSSERDVLVCLSQYPAMLHAAAQEHSPALVANYTYELAKLYNKFYHEEIILKLEDEELKNFRLSLSAATAKTIKMTMSLLGILVPDRM
ncbi:MAG: DALR anticodon-binding domain-containing protein, partial [Sphingobacteriaceae bacterium]